MMKSDSEISVRIAAAEALYRWGKKEGVIQTLSEAPDSDIEMIRPYALNVLEMMGKEAFPPNLKGVGMALDELQLR